MQVLVGDTRSEKNLARLRQHGWGRMFQEARITPFANEPFGFDNCAFLYWRRGVPFDSDKYLRRLEGAIKAGVPYLAVVPDIVAGGVRSLELSWQWFGIGRLLPTEWPWYLAVQDGMTRRDVEGVIRGGWTGIFLGGTNAFKSKTAFMWRELAGEFGLKFHYGRAGTPKKIEHAKTIRADSLDSAFPLWTERRFLRFIDHIVAPSTQMGLAYGESS